MTGYEKYESIVALAKLGLTPQDIVDLTITSFPADYTVIVNGKTIKLPDDAAKIVWGYIKQNKGRIMNADGIIFASQGKAKAKPENIVIYTREYLTKKGMVDLWKSLGWSQGKAVAPSSVDTLEDRQRLIDYIVNKGKDPRN